MTMLRMMALAGLRCAVSLHTPQNLRTTARSSGHSCCSAASRRSVIRYTATDPLVGIGETANAGDDEKIYATAPPPPPSGLFGARSSIEPYLALEIPVVDETATTKEDEEGSSFGLDLEMRRPGGFAPVVDASGKTQSKDWLHCISTWPQSYVLRRIANPLGAIVVWSSLVAAWYRVFRPFVKPLGTGMHTLVGGALSLLLVFRTNTACVGRVGATGRARVVASMASGDSLVHTGTTASGTAGAYSVR